MKNTSKFKAQTVSEWLEIATKDLAPSAKQRIASEIESHYADALQAHCAEGQNTPNASLHALKELGDPSVAARIYRREYLTAKEAARLRSLITESRKPYPRLFVFSAGAFALSMALQFVNLRSMNCDTLLFSSCLFISFGLIPFVSRQLMKKYVPAKALNIILLLQPFRFIGTVLPFFCLFPARSDNALSLFEPFRTIGIVLNDFNLPATLLWSYLLIAFLIRAAWDCYWWLRIRSKTLSVEA